MKLSHNTAGKSAAFTLSQYLALAVAPLSAGALAQPGGGFGDNASYTRAGLEYVSQKLDDFDCTQDGLNAYGSLAIDENWFVRGNFIDVSGDGCGSNTLTLGGGYHTPLNDTFDLYGTVNMQRLSIDAGGDDTGVAARAGVRGMVNEQLEADVSIDYTSIQDGDFSLNGGVAYYFTSSMAGTVGASASSDSTALKVGARINF